MKTLRIATVESCGLLMIVMAKLLLDEIHIAYTLDRRESVSTTYLLAAYSAAEAQPTE